MRERMERLASFPFSAGCVSQSSVDVLEACHPRRPRSERAPPPPTTEDVGEREAKTMARALGAGIPKAVMKGIRSISQLFYDRPEGEDGEDVMEIGYPTDVQHVAHVGPDSLNALCPADLDGRPGSAPELFFLPSVSLAQLVLAMNRS